MGPQYLTLFLQYFIYAVSSLSDTLEPTRQVIFCSSLIGSQFRLTTNNQMFTNMKKKT